MTPHEQARRAQWLADQTQQRALDALLAGNPIAKAALVMRYAPINQFRKEGPDVGEREEVQSEAGRVN